MLRRGDSHRNKQPSRQAGIVALLACLMATAPSGAPVVLAADAAAPLLSVWTQVFARPDTSLDKIPAPPDNPLTKAKINLGRQLFFDVRLSGDETRSCASCHSPERAFTDGEKRARAHNGGHLDRNTPTLFDLAWSNRLFWDARSENLEDQARHPIESGMELNGHWPDITMRLRYDARSQKAFAAAFPQDPEVHKENILKALASYERSLVSPTSRFDRFIGGDQKALSAQERRGFRLFVGKAGCVSCHSGWRLTDGQQHRVGTLAGKPAARQPGIKTPTLRHVSKTGPFMHDGRFSSLEEVVSHYTSFRGGGLGAENVLSENLTRPLRLSSDERNALIAFLGAL